MGRKLVGICRSTEPQATPEGCRGGNGSLSRRKRQLDCADGEGMPCRARGGARIEAFILRDTGEPCYRPPPEQ